MPRSRECPSPNSRPSTPQHRPICGWRGSWSPVAPSPDERDPPVTEPVEEAGDGFRVSLGVFDGPFDLLLTLLSKHELDITEVSLSLVPAEFIAYLRQVGPDEDRDE